MRLVDWAAMALIGGAVLSGACGTKQPPQPPPAPTPAPSPVLTGTAPPARTATPPVAPAPAAPPPLSESEAFARLSLDDLNASHPLDDIFFEYDSADFTDATRSTLERDAAWLHKWPSTAIRIEGHADERGTGEYNLALGERRATMVESYLHDLGIDTTRLAHVSKGKEEPFCVGHSESCWSSNRRAHFIVTAK
jgi:peptidoglycan-associated lipoprotein